MHPIPVLYLTLCRCDAVPFSIISSIHCLAVWQYSLNLKLSDAINQEINVCHQRPDRFRKVLCDKL